MIVVVRCKARPHTALQVIHQRICRCTELFPAKEVLSSRIGAAMVVQWDECIMDV